MTQQTPDSAVVARVRKLLAMTVERGATEAEAQVAAAKAATLMEEYGLEMLTVERAGGEGEARDKTEKQSAFGAWYAQLMYAVAESCFCYCEVYELGKGSAKKLRFLLIGRKSAVVTAEITYEYLRAAIWRLARESGVENQRLFRHGCAERVTERLRERHARVLREQQERATTAQAARTAQPGAASTALVVTLVDHAQREKDLNEDFRRGVAPGTTQREREEREAREAAKQQRMRELSAKHGWDVAWWMVERDKTLEEAVAIEQEAEVRRENVELLRAEETEEDKARRLRRENRDQEYADRVHRKQQEKQERERRKQRDKRSHPSFRQGVQTGEHVGLDQQIGSGATPASRGSRRIS